MTDAIFSYLVIAEDDTSHEHHHRMAATETIDTVLHAALGGWPRHIRVTNPAMALCCDQDGSPRRRPANLLGSLLVVGLGGGAAGYLGPILVTGLHGGHPVSLTCQQIEQLLAALRRCRN